MSAVSFTGAKRYRCVGLVLVYCTGFEYKDQGGGNDGYTVL
jgi:hypothetical protein